MDSTQIALTEKERAYVNMLGNHVNMYKALLLDIAGPAQVAPDGTASQVSMSRELALAYTRMEEAFYHAREHIFKRASVRHVVN